MRFWTGNVNGSSTPSPPGTENRVALRLTLAGHVQGIGLRPAVARLAGELGLGGRVANGLAGVVIEVEGGASRVESFRERLPRALPAAARVDGIEAVVVEPRGRDAFLIDAGREAGPPSTPVPRDVAACGACLAEVADPSDRRYGYGFTSCTECGPRYSIVERMPYERGSTAMGGFALCPRCRAEYEAAEARRFHAQTNACGECGPRVWCVEAGGRLVADDSSATAYAAERVRAGAIVALKGLGGYQLVVDATNAAAVGRLRERKRRPVKPLALMVRTVEEVERLAVLDGAARAELSSPTGAVVVVPARTDSPLAANVAPGLRDVGVMRPTTPLHGLLLDRVGRPLVVTSGNVDGEPLAFEEAGAEGSLREVADVFLHHDRPVVRPVDDSVVRVAGERGVTIRAGRGIAPLPLGVECGVPVLAVGGQQKCAVALSNGRQAVLGPHVGEMDGLAMRARFEEQVRALCALYGAEPEVVVHDRHPDYFTTEWAQRCGRRTVAVQHHHAHVAAGMLEHGWLEREVLGVAFDGTGFGADGTVWGGEFLRATVRGFERVGHLRAFGLAGGEAAVREPWRVAVALVVQAAGGEAAKRLRWEDVEADDVRRVAGILGNRRLSVVTTSVGRLFDGVAALVLGVSHCGTEGRPAMLLEAAIDGEADGAYAFDVTESAPLELDWRPVVRAVLRDREAGVPAGAIAARFHAGLAEGIAAVCGRFDELPVVPCGGVFQNRALTELLAERLADRALGLPGRIPPNDGGLAAGQLAIAAARLDEEG